MPRIISNLSDIGKRVEQWLDGKSFKALAIELGVPPNTLRYNLKKGASPKTPLLKEIAACFDKTLDELIHGNTIHQINNTSENSEKSYSSKYKELESGILKEIQEWISHMEQLRPGRKVWFTIEFENRFPEFEEWRQSKKKQAGNSH